MINLRDLPFPGGVEPLALMPGKMMNGTAVVLSTIWGTIVYFDEHHGTLRHRQMNFTETNCVFITIAGSAHGAFLRPDAPDDHLVQVDVHGLAQAPSSTLPANLALIKCFFHISFIGGEYVSLHSRGRFLGYDPSGEIMLANTWRRDWEKFRIVEVARSSLPSIARERRRYDSLLRLVQAQRPAHYDIAQKIVKGRSGPRPNDRRPIHGLIICRYKWLETYICFEHLHLIRHLHLEHGFDILDTEGVELTSYQTIDAMNAYDVVVVAYQGGYEIPLHLVSAYKILKIDDLESYSPSYQSMVTRMSCASNMLVGPYAYEIPKFFPHPNIRWLPYSSAIIEEGGLLPFNHQPIEKLLVSGSLAADRPFRQFVAGLDDPRIHKLAHPGYDKGYTSGSEEAVRHRWFSELRKYLCAFCDAHSLRYIHLRAFEVASVGALLVADDLVEAEMNELGFIDRVTCIFSNRDNFFEKLDWVLAPENRGDVDRIRKNGMDLCLQRHLTSQRADEFVAMVESDSQFRTYYQQAV
jgi:hypothetical protein